MEDAPRPHRPGGGAEQPLFLLPRAWLTFQPWPRERIPIASRTYLGFLTAEWGLFPATLRVKRYGARATEHRLCPVYTVVDRSRQEDR